MRRDKGFTLITLIFLLGLAAFAALAAFRVIPAYMDYYAVKGSLENILASDGPKSNEALRGSFAKRLDVNFIKSVDARDLDINTENGMLTLTVPVSRKGALFGGVSLCVDLEAKASAPVK